MRVRKVLSIITIFLISLSACSRAPEIVSSSDVEIAQSSDSSKAESSSSIDEDSSSDAGVSTDEKEVSSNAPPSSSKGTETSSSAPSSQSPPSSSPSSQPPSSSQPVNPPPTPPVSSQTPTVPDTPTTPQATNSCFNYPFDWNEIYNALVARGTGAGMNHRTHYLDGEEINLNTCGSYRMSHLPSKDYSGYLLENNLFEQIDHYARQGEKNFTIFMVPEGNSQRIYILL